MKTRGRKGTIGTILICSMLLGIITGCGASDEDSSVDVSTEEVTTSQDETEAEVKTETIIVGTSTSYMPYCYLDSDTNEFTGYDVEVLKAVDELLPQYEFEFQGYDTTERLMALESDKIDIAAGQFEKNEEREEKYLFSTVGYTNASSQIVVAGDNTTINSIDDLSGKSVYVISNSNASYQMEKYNTDNDANIDLVYGENNFEVINTMLENGSIDAYIQTARTVALNNEAYGTDHKVVGDPIMASETYFLFNKSNTALQEEVDGALTELKESGKLAEICIEWLGQDFTPEN
ncbi:MAG: transporter substrate-binding domain-containing protein [Clostridiales bacterium]|nr:transporter substrate-binding domain-containing protein [Clostridiales bacterium]